MPLGADDSKQQTKKDRMLRKGIIRGLIVLCVVYAMVMMWHWTIGFTFFTQLSNLFVGIVVALQLAMPEHPFLRLKYMATVSILVTFLIYLSVLAPLGAGGFLASYLSDHGASLCMHLLVPGLTVADFLLHDRGDRLEDRDVALSILPPLVWFLLILLLGQSGVSWFGMSAPYLFLNYSAPAGWFGFMPETAGRTTLGIGVAYALAVLILLILLLGKGLLMAAGWVRRRRS